MRSGQARVRGRRIGLQLAVVEDAHDVALLVRLRLHRRFAADPEQVLRLQVRREVEAEWREVAVMRTEQLAVEPCVRGQERAADPKQHAPRTIGALKLGAAPPGLAAFTRGPLPGNLD